MLIFDACCAMLLLLWCRFDGALPPPLLHNTPCCLLLISFDFIFFFIFWFLRWCPLYISHYHCCHFRHLLDWFAAFITRHYLFSHAYICWCAQRHAIYDAMPPLLPPFRRLCWRCAMPPCISFCRHAVIASLMIAEALHCQRLLYFLRYFSPERATLVAIRAVFADGTPPRFATTTPPCRYDFRFSSLCHVYFRRFSSFHCCHGYAFMPLIIAAMRDILLIRLIIFITPRLSFFVTRVSFRCCHATLFSFHWCARWFFMPLSDFRRFSLMPILPDFFLRWAIYYLFDAIIYLRCFHYFYFRHYFLMFLSFIILLFSFIIIWY